MLTKRATIVGLIGLNVLLLASLILSGYSLPSAFAQPRARGGDFLSVTVGVAGQSYDVVYVLDLPKRMLHAFYPEIPSNQLRYAGYRDLNKDMRQ